MASNILLFEKFTCTGELEVLCSTWKKWKRGLEIYFAAANITDPKTKQTTLLHLGSLQLQEIFYSLANSHDSTNNTDNEYEKIITKFDEYFQPKVRLIYERHVFRNIKQEIGETVENFINRLKKQTEKCQFSNIDEHIIDQLTEKCAITEIRKKILLLQNEDKFE